MSNLNNNTTQLEALLAKVNALPEAGSGGTDTTDATATADEIFAGETAYTADGKVTGTFTIEEELSTQDDLITQIQNAVNNLPEADSGEITLQNKIVTPATSSQTINADSGYDGLDTVTVNAMPTATQATPSISVSSSGLITASTTQSAGYVVSGTKSTTKQLTTQVAKTITPSTSSQTAVASGVYTTGNITIAAIPSTYVQPAATKGATTYTPTTSDQKISPGTYITGVQTIKGDANLIPANIVSGKSIFGVEGSATSGGGDFETATVSITSYRSDHYIGYTGINEAITQSNFSSLTFTCIKPSVVYLETRGAGVNTTTNIERLQTPFNTPYLFVIKGDGTITLTSPGGGADD